MIKKIKLFISLVVISMLLISCDQGINFNGTVIDKTTCKPVQGVKISVKDRYTLLTDTMGRYNFSKMNYGYMGNVELLFEKDGYKSKMFNLEFQKDKQLKAVIELEKSEGKFENSIDRKYVKTMNYFNLYVITLLILLTLVFISSNKNIKARLVWIILIMWYNITFYFSFTDFSLIKFQFMNGPFYGSYYSWDPYSFKIMIPLATILFWLIYIFKRNWLIAASKTVVE